VILISLASTPSVIQFSYTYAQNLNDNGQNNSLSVEDYVFKGIDTADLGNYTGALEYYDKALSLDGNNTFPLSMKGFTLALLGNYTGAIEYYDKVLTINPEDSTVLTSKGISLTGLGNYTGALEYYDKALSLDGNDSFALENKEIVISILSLIKETNNGQSSETFDITNDLQNFDLKLRAHLIIDPDTYTILENAYRVDDLTGIYVITNNNKLNSQVYHLTSSPKSLVQNSDSQIEIDMTFKIPVFPNSTLESIEKINGSYDVRYLDTQPDHTKLVAYSNSTINFNNTNYSNLTVELKKYFNGTTYLFIEGIRH
jgi:tetratricopeptide (TPR) repeat protein